MYKKLNYQKGNGSYISQVSQWGEMGPDMEIVHRINRGGWETEKIVGMSWYMNEE
jgi:hypothetical protein